MAWEYNHQAFVEPEADAYLNTFSVLINLPAVVSKVGAEVIEAAAPLKTASSPLPSEALSALLAWRVKIVSMLR